MKGRRNLTYFQSALIVASFALIWTSPESGDRLWVQVSIILGLTGLGLATTVIFCVGAMKPRSHPDPFYWISLLQAGALAMLFVAALIGTTYHLAGKPKESAINALHGFSITALLICASGILYLLWRGWKDRMGQGAHQHPNENQTP